MTKVDAYYFGCWSKDQKGHHLYKNGLNWSMSRADEKKELPPKLDSYGLDNPKLANHRGQSKLTRWESDGYTIISMEDFSADSRPNSNASFFIQGSHSTEEMIKLFFERFPLQANRINDKKTLSE